MRADFSGLFSNKPQNDENAFGTPKALSNRISEHSKSSSCSQNLAMNAFKKEQLLINEVSLSESLVILLIGFPLVPMRPFLPISLHYAFLVVCCLFLFIWDFFNGIAGHEAKTQWAKEVKEGLPDWECSIEQNQRNIHGPSNRRGNRLL